MSYKGREFFDLTRLLVPHMDAVPAWHDLAKATSEVMERHIENPRRSLERVRDTTLYRRDDTLKNIPFTQGTVIEADTGQPVSIPRATNIPRARILAVEQNEPIGNDPGTDYLIVEFTLSNGKVYHWKMPVSAPQERSLLIQNGYMLGFDFFNTTFTDEDYRRLNEFISMYWPEGGTENFVRFISFVKNIRLEVVPLWTYDSNDDTYPTLEPQKDSMVPVWKGGKWYQSSHVELRHNPLRDQADTGSDPNDNFRLYKGVEELFYLFAPIHLVLDRIVAAIDQYFDFFYSTAGHEMEAYYGKWAWTYSDGTTGDMFMEGGLSIEIAQQRYSYRWPVMKSVRGMSAAHQIESLHYTVSRYEVPEIEFDLIFGWNTQINENVQARTFYQWPVMKNYVADGAAGEYLLIVSDTVAYERPDLIGNKDLAAVSEFFVYELLIPARFEPEFFVPGVISEFESRDENLFFSGVRGTATFNDWDAYDGTPYPSRRINALYATVVMSEHTIIFGMNDPNVPLHFPSAPVIGTLPIQIFQGRVESTRRL